jgi:transposase
MKNQAIQYLAFDIHQSTTTATVRDSDGNARMRATIRTTAKDLLGVARSAGPRVHVAIEEGTQAQWVHDVLHPHVERIVVWRARDLGGNKNDRLEADRLSDLLRMGALKPVFHQIEDMRTLRELVRNYVTLVQDTTRLMLRIKAIFRGRGIGAAGTKVYSPAHREQWLKQLRERGVRSRAATLYEQLDVAMELRRRAKTAMLGEARRQRGWKILRSIPFFGPIRSALLLAIIVTPFRFRTKRALWPYAGLAVVTRSSADHEIDGAQLRRRRRAPLTRGLNRNHNPILKSVFKGAANAAASKSGPLRDCFDASVARGVRPELAKVTLARKIASVTLTLWKKGELWDPKKLTMQTT